jgi:hypothetical protein
LPRGDSRCRTPRTWGYWTEQKLSTLAAYLPAFTTASQKSSRTLYLDLFAGQDRNLSRTTGEQISGSPRVALDTRPPFSKAIFFELPIQAEALAAELRSSYPTRDFEIVSGDCNQEIADVLAQLTAEEFGTDLWRDAYFARKRSLITGAELRDELLNLMRWRLENVLGYKATHSFGMRNTKASRSMTWSSLPTMTQVKRS